MAQSGAILGKMRNHVMVIGMAIRTVKPTSESFRVTGKVEISSSEAS